MDVTFKDTLLVIAHLLTKGYFKRKNMKILIYKLKKIYDTIISHENIFVQ